MTDPTQAFWKKRSKNFNNLEWATSSKYEKKFLDAGDFAPTDTVLDVGCGTGIITKLIAPYVQHVVGLDISPDMLRLAEEHPHPNESFVLGDACAMPFQDNLFDKVTARMVFHHLLENVQQGVNECYRVLRPGGTLILSEGIPPGEEIAGWYTEMFRLKEERLTFSRASLKDLLTKAGFRHIEMIEHVTEQSSVKNWLENSALSKEQQSIIMEMHRTMPPIGKKLYNATVTADDVLIDMVFLIFATKK